MSRCHNWQGSVAGRLTFSDVSYAIGIAMQRPWNNAWPSRQCGPLSLAAIPGITIPWLANEGLTPNGSPLIPVLTS
ncbi:hypothetical protein EMIT0111MI5_180007 [Burkholderia sp. IT-111MI5]